MRKFLVTSLLLFGLVSFGLASPAQADDAAERARVVEELSAEGAAYFGEGEFEKAIERFEEAYAVEPVPNLLYNIGRCYEQLEEWETAKDYFEDFIRSPDVDSESRGHAMDRVDSLREIIAAETGEEPEERPEDEPEEQEVTEVEEVDEPNLIPAFAALGGGGALLLGGLGLGLLANGNAESMTDTTLSYDERLSAQSTARTQGIAADVMFVTGLVATGAGVYLLLTAGSGADDGVASRGALTPWVGRDGGGFGVHFDF